MHLALFMHLHQGLKANKGMPQGSIDLEEIDLSNPIDIGGSQLLFGSI